MAKKNQTYDASGNLTTGNTLSGVPSFAPFLNLPPLGGVSSSGGSVSMTPSNIGATGGAAAYGSVPAPVSTADPATLYKTIYPNLTADIATARNNNAALMRGEIPTDEATSVWDKRAAQAAAGGVAGSTFTGANQARDLGLRTLELQQQGQTNLNNLLNTTYNTAVGPAISTQEKNAELAASPNPAAAAAEQQRIFERNQQQAFQNQQIAMIQQFALQSQLAKQTAAQNRVSGMAAPKEYSYSTTPYNSGYGGAPSYQYKYYQ